MSKMKFSSSSDKSRLGRFLSSKGFYVALAVCLVGASAATWMAVNRTISGIENSNSQMLENENLFTEFPQLEEAETKREDVPKSSETPEQYSTPSSSSSTASSSSTISDDASDSSEQQASSAILPTLSYALPVRGEITNPYSNGELVKNVTLNDWRTHDGIDIAAKKGDEILAVADGTVVDVTNDPLWGTTVTIRHADNNESIYSGLSSELPVKVGETVLVKQVIGTLEGVPCEVNEGEHLHFAMRNGDQWIDPLSVFVIAD